MLIRLQSLEFIADIILYAYSVIIQTSTIISFSVIGTTFFSLMLSNVLDVEISGILEMTVTNVKE